MRVFFCCAKDIIENTCNSCHLGLNELLQNHRRRRIHCNPESATFRHGETSRCILSVFVLLPIRPLGSDPLAGCFRCSLTEHCSSGTSSRISKSSNVASIGRRVRPMRNLSSPMPETQVVIASMSFMYKFVVVLWVLT
jgi:hypothetical protein